MKLNAVKAMNPEPIETVFWSEVSDGVIVVDLQFDIKRPRVCGGTEQGVIVEFDGADEPPWVFINFETDKPVEVISEGWGKWTIRLALIAQDLVNREDCWPTIDVTDVPPADPGQRE